MRKLFSLFAIMALTFGGLTAQDEGVKQIKQLNIGDKLPVEVEDIILKGTNGYSTKLKNEFREEGLMVVFSCNTCPYVLAWEDRYNILASNCVGIRIGFVALNSNEAKRDGADSFEAMEKKAKEFQYMFPYLVDENHVIADAFGATKTPDVFLFNSDRELVYKGAIDDNQDFEYVDNTWLANAAVNMTTEKPINPEVTKAVGCTIKRLHKVEIVTE